MQFIIYSEIYGISTDLKVFRSIQTRDELSLINFCNGKADLWN